MRLLSLLAACALVRADRIEVPHGGIALAEYVLGQLPALDYHGESPLIFVAQPSLDQYVSGGLLAGGWENNLNQLYKTILDDEKPMISMITMDVGANLGAFSMYVASLGRKLIAFEMQPSVHMLLELSRRVNNYNRMQLFHTALWNESGHTISFTPLRGNLGGTAAHEDGAGTHKMTTTRIDDFFHGSEIFFLKIDVENAEEYVLQGLNHHLTTGRVKHLVMETRKNQAFIVEWFYDIGFKCGLYDRNLDEKDSFVQRVANQWNLDAYMDIYCKYVGGGAPRPLVSRRSLLGVYKKGLGWR